MMQDTRESVFHPQDVEEVIGYRSVTPLAIFGLIFGLASPLCMAWPLLTILPLIGAVVSILAIRRIAASEGLLAGRVPAVIGLTLSVVFAVGAITRDYTSQYLRIWQAEGFGKEFLELLVSGDVEGAFRKTIDGSRPTLPPPPEPDAPPEEQVKPFDAFRDQPLVKAVVACAADSEIKFLETLKFERRSGRQVYIQQKFRITPTAAAPISGEAAAAPVELVLEIQRTRFQNDTGMRWFVSKVQDPATAESQ